MSKASGFSLFLVLAMFTAPAVAGKDLDLTIVYDNNPYKEGLETRWGFSCLVRGTEKTILFDVGGEGPVLLGNMEKLKIKPQEVDIIVLSHVHLDHIGGLPDFLKRNGDVTVYMPKSLPKSVKHQVRKAGAKLVEVSEAMQICRDVYSTGELGTWLKEQSLVIRTSKGLVLVTGCAHPGIANIVREAKQEFGGEAHLVLGGFHLCGMAARQITKVLAELKEEHVMKVAPCHCSGDLARRLFKEAFREDFIRLGVGKTIKVENAFPDREQNEDKGASREQSRD